MASPESPLVLAPARQDIAPSGRDRACRSEPRELGPFRSPPSHGEGRERHDVDGLELTVLPRRWIPEEGVEDDAKTEDGCNANNRNAVCRVDVAGHEGDGGDGGDQEEGEVGASVAGVSPDALPQPTGSSWWSVPEHDSGVSTREQK